jgi:hypothetical protein
MAKTVFAPSGLNDWKAILQGLMVPRSITNCSNEITGHTGRRFAGVSAAS